MTTILGIKVPDEENPSVVLAADMMVTIFDDEEAIGKETKVKMYSDEETWVLASAGNRDSNLTQLIDFLKRSQNHPKLFRRISNLKRQDVARILQDPLDPRYGLPPDLKAQLARIIKGKTQDAVEKQVYDVLQGTVENPTPLETFLQQLCISSQRNPVEDMIYRGLFKQGMLLNVESARQGVEAEDASEFLLAVRQQNEGRGDSVGLYRIDYQANVTEVGKSSTGLVYSCLGTGSEIVDKFLEEEQYLEDSIGNGAVNWEKIDIGNITTRQAYQLAIRAIIKAQTDPNTLGPIDVAIVTPDGIDFGQGERIREELRRTELKLYEKRWNRY